jgi:vitamin B12 transporter
METVVATGTRTPGPTGFTAATSIDAQAIAARNDATVSELLAAVPGVYVSSASGRGGIASAFVRGGEANFTPVLIDGIQVNDPTNTRGGSFDFSALNVDDIERVEIVRGPLSSVYGSDALAGVISIVTHEASGARTAGANAEVGSGAFRRFGARLAGPVGDRQRLGIAASAASEATSEDTSTYRAKSVNGRWSLSGASDVSLSLRHTESDASAYPDASGGPLLAVMRDKDSRSTRGDSLGLDLATPGSHGLDWHLTASWFDHSEQAVSAGVAPGVLEGLPATADDSNFRRTALGFFVTNANPDRLQGALGLAYQSESGSSDGVISFAPGFDVPTNYEIARDEVGLFGEVSYAASRRLAVSAAARTDRVESGGTRATGKLAVSYTLANDMRVRLSWGQGFKLPSLFALGHPLVGNPDLLPELATTVEAGLEAQAVDNGFGWQVNAFEQRFKDLIDFDFDTFMSVNRSRVNADGIELVGRFVRGERWQLDAHATVLSVEVLGSAVPLTQRPERLGVINASWRMSDALQGFLSWRYVGRRYDSSIPTGARFLPSYQRTDLSVGWDLSASVRLNFSIDNFFDREYESAIGFPDPGRVVRIGVRYRSL